VVLEADGAEYQTSNEYVHVDQVIVEWHEHILLQVVLNSVFPGDIEKDCRPRELALWTDAGHRLLARYRRMQNSSDLDTFIGHFERALDLQLKSY
jgi:hypothetical protein